MSEALSRVDVAQPVVLSQRDVGSTLPHSGRALLIRHGATIDPVDRSGTAPLVVTRWLCTGHFGKDRFVCPGKEYQEAACQLIALVAHQCDQRLAGVGVVRGVQGARFRRSAVPGECLIVRAGQVEIAQRRNLICVTGNGRVEKSDGCLVAEFDRIELVARLNGGADE